jgi:beta-lactamase class A
MPKQNFGMEPICFTYGSRRCHEQSSHYSDVGTVTLPDGRHLAIAVFVKDSTADEATREATIANIARACRDRWAAARTREGHE